MTRRPAAVRRCRRDPSHTTALRVIADELLVAIFGGRWRPCGRPFKLLKQIAHELRDHPEVFRRVGARGPHSWRNCIVAAQPYSVFAEAALATRHAAAGLRPRGLIVWASPHFSFWFPGRTSLVLIFAMPAAASPVACGFSCLSPPPTRCGSM